MSELVIIRVDFAKLNGQVCQVQRKKLRNFSINAQQRKSKGRLATHAISQKKPASKLPFSENPCTASTKQIKCRQK